MSCSCLSCENVIFERSCFLLVMRTLEEHFIIPQTLFERSLNVVNLPKHLRKNLPWTHAYNTADVMKDQITRTKDYERLFVTSRESRRNLNSHVFFRTSYFSSDVCRTQTLYELWSHAWTYYFIFYMGLKKSRLSITKIKNDISVRSWRSSASSAFKWSFCINIIYSVILFSVVPVSWDWMTEARDDH